MSDEELGTEEVQETPEGEQIVETEQGEPEAESEIVEEPPLTESAAPVVQTPAPSAYESEPVTGMPPHRQTGLIVVVGSIALILILALVFWQPLFGALTKLTTGTAGTGTETLTPAKAKVTAAIGFVEAYMDQDVLKMKPYLSDSAQAAATDADWKATAAAIPTGSIAFTAPVWSSDTTAVLTFSAPDASTGSETTGTLTLGVSDAQPLVVTMLFDSGGSVDTINFNLEQAGTTWRILGESSAGGASPYDAEFVKSIITTGTAQ